MVYSPEQVVANYQSFLYNPSDPVPTIGGNNLLIACGPKDQSDLYERGDILSYITQPLTNNMLICGRMEAVSFQVEFSSWKLLGTLCI